MIYATDHLTLFTSGGTVKERHKMLGPQEAHLPTGDDTTKERVGGVQMRVLRSAMGMLSGALPIRGASRPPRGPGHRRRRLRGLPGAEDSHPIFAQPGRG